MVPVDFTSPSTVVIKVRCQGAPITSQRFLANMRALPDRNSDSTARWPNSAGYHCLFYTENDITITKEV